MRMEIHTKYTLATRRNCSNSDLGNHVSKLYLVVVIALLNPLVLMIPSCTFIFTSTGGWYSPSYPESR
jgi:hypothetical protein